MARSRTVLALAAFTILILSACSRVDPIKPYRDLQSQLSGEANQITKAVPTEPTDIYQIIVRSGTRRVELLRSTTGTWSPGEGATQTSADLMAEDESVLLPLMAYRRMAVDATDPGFGFATTDLRATLVTYTNRTWELRLGDTTPTGAGDYLQVGGDPNVYAVVPQVKAALESLLTGTPVEAPTDPRVQSVLNGEATTKDPEEVTNPWLRQVEEFEAGPSTSASP